MKPRLMLCIACVVLAQSACATRPAPGISGHWKTLNRYAAQTQEIPLHPAYEFQASPLDQTLDSMLTRWARDSKMTLDYRHRSDFTLYEPVSRIHSTDLRQALESVSNLYSPQHVSAGVEGNAIVVREIGPGQAGEDKTALSGTPAPRRAP